MFDYAPVANGLIISLSVPLVILSARSLWKSYEKRQNNQQMFHKMLSAFMGTDDDPISGQKGEEGIFQQLQDIHTRIGSNGGSTLFENLAITQEQVSRLHEEQKVAGVIRKEMADQIDRVEWRVEQVLADLERERNLTRSVIDALNENGIVVDFGAHGTDQT
jgi:hypothetical protein